MNLGLGGKMKKIIKKALKPLSKKVVAVEPDERQEEIKRAKSWSVEPDERQEEIKRVKKFFGKE